MNTPHKRNFETERLQMIPFSAEYKDFFFRLNSNKNVMRYTGDQPFKNAAEAKAFLESYKAFEQTGFERLLVLRNKVPIGWCGLKLHANKEVDLGFRFLEEEWGKGYATEAAKAMIHYAFDDLHLQQLIARVLPNNKASIRVLEKLNFTPTGNVTCGDFQNALKFTLLNP